MTSLIISDYLYSFFHFHFFYSPRLKIRVKKKILYFLLCFSIFWSKLFSRSYCHCCCYSCIHNTVHIMRIIYQVWHICWILFICYERRKKECKEEFMIFLFFSYFCCMKLIFIFGKFLSLLRVCVAYIKEKNIKVYFLGKQ